MADPSSFDFIRSDGTILESWAARLSLQRAVASTIVEKAVGVPVAPPSPGRQALLLQPVMLDCRRPLRVCEERWQAWIRDLIRNGLLHPFAPLVSELRYSHFCELPHPIGPDFMVRSPKEVSEMARRSIAERLAQLKARKKGACIVVGEGSTGRPGDKAKGFARRIRASSVRDDQATGFLDANA